MFLIDLLVIMVLVAINGFFVAVEFAAVTARKTRIEVLAGKDNPSAKIVQSWLENPAARDRLIAGAQLGITIVSLALGALGENAFEALLEPYFHDLQLPPVLESFSSVLSALPLVLSLIIVTSLHVTLGEQVPKVAALHSPERVAMMGARPMNLFVKIFKWFVGILDWATRMILKAFGMEAIGSHSMVYSIEELKQIVAESEEGGILETPDLKMLYAIFDFSDLLVRQVMIPRTEIIAIEAESSIDECIEIAATSNYTKFPVYEKKLDNIIGIVNIRDIMRAHLELGESKHTARTLAREGLYVPETISVKSLLHKFRTSRRHIAIVLDEYSGTAGIVTLEDIVEEIVGEVSDPYDSELPEIHKLSDGSYIIDGLALIEDVNQELQLDIEEPNYDTIAGFMISKLGRLAAVGDTVIIDSTRMKVQRMDGLRIASILVAPVQNKTIEGENPEQSE